MPLEDIEGSGKFPDDLNSAWPLGSDSPSEGDDHLRGIKNVIRNWAGTYGDGPLSDLLTAAFAPLVHTHVWADITDPPSEFPPEPHTHLAAEITDLADVFEAELAPYALLESPDFSGIPALDGEPLATQEFVVGEVHKTHLGVNNENYTLTLADIGRSVIMSNMTADRTITVPPSSSVAFPAGTRINIGNTSDTHKTTIAGGSGVIIASKDSLRTVAGGYAGATLELLGGNTWWLVGDLS